MSLSQRAIEYLKTLNRNPDWITEEQETNGYLKNLDIGNFDNISNTQLKYSGYELTVNNDDRFTYEINFISKYHIEKNKRIYTERVNDEIIFDFENNKKSYYYFITESGRICTKNEDSPREIHYSFDKIETKIEQFALLNEFYYFKAFPSTNWNVTDFEKLKNELSDFEQIPECCDSLNFCCKNDQVLILISPWIGSTGKFLSIYGIDNSFSQKIISRLEKKYVIE